MEIHEEFTAWAVEQGVEINGIAAHKFEGRGLGIIATKKHKANTTLLTVPLSALINLSTIPKDILQALPPTKTTTHNILATFLTLDASSPVRAPWRAVLPSHASFRASMPLCWPRSLQALLPPQAAALLAHQQQKLQKDWALATAAFPDVRYDVYQHAWLLVNTRTFYYVSPTASARSIPKNRDDCMALNPFADYFNHTSAATACEVAFSKAGYTFTTPAALLPGDEIFISYGPHSNDFLLAEYGFIIPSPSPSSPPSPSPSEAPFSGNQNDTTPLDRPILHRLSAAQRDVLADEGFLGTYTLDRETVCHRTQVALRLLCGVPVGRWRRFVGGMDDGAREQGKVDALLLNILKSYRQEVVAAKIRDVGELLEEGTSEMRRVLGERWRQIDELLRSAVERLEH